MKCCRLRPGRFAVRHPRDHRALRGPPRRCSGLRGLLLAAICLAFAGAALGSQVLFANYDPATFSGLTGTGPGPRITPGVLDFRNGAAFSTDSSGYTLNSVELCILPTLGNITNLVVSLYSDAAGTPGTALAPLALTAGPDALNNRLFACTALNLAPYSTYWVVAEATAAAGNKPSDFLWFSSRTLGPVASDFGDSGTTAWDDWTADASGPGLSLVVYATPVPEPSPFPLLLLGAIALGRLGFSAGPNCRPPAPARR